MITIEPFPLPSDMSKVIHFRAPTVFDSMAIADINPDLEESATTSFLNRQQDQSAQGGQLFDSLEWTGEDRRTALWWIFVSTRQDTLMPYQFTVDGKEVNIDIDLRELGNTSSVLSIAPEVPIEFEVNGRKLNAKVVPLNGHAMEAIEMARVSRSNHEPNSVPYRKLSNRIAMLEMTHGMRIDGEPPLLEPAIEYRGKLIMEMEIDTEFRAFFAAMTAARRKLTHGLATVYKDGVYLLVTMRELAEGKGEQPIMFPFQANNFLPAI